MFLNSKEINQFKTIVIDPLGEMADQIKAYIIKTDPKNAKDGRKLYPAIGNEYKNVWTILKNKGLSILFVSHTDEVLKNDVESLESNNFDGLQFPELYFFQPKKIFFQL